MWHTKMHFSAKCNSGRIAIQWFHIKHYLDYQYTKFQPYTFWVQKMCVFARYATLVPRLSCTFIEKWWITSFKTFPCLISVRWFLKHWFKVLLDRHRCGILTHISLASFLWDIDKQSRPRSDAAECRVWSGSSLLAYRMFNQNLNKDEKYHLTYL